MKTENVVLMKHARESLSGKWPLAIGTFVVYYLINGCVQSIPFAGIVGSLLIGGPMLVGVAVFSLSLSRNTYPRFEQIFDGFKKFDVALGAYLLTFIFVLLWSLLLIIPGIIAALSYSMTFFILADNDSIGAMEAIDQSKAMMDGYKWKLFYLGLRFLGLALLCILTLGIGFLWLIPYIQVTMAKFYDDLKGVPVMDENYDGHLGEFEVKQL
ncbi:MAG: DUF975 family protein [Ferruginibacter sp.]